MAVTEHLAAILASCAFDPNHPNAPCNDTPSDALLVAALWILGVLCVSGVIWLILRRSRSL